ncbi:MAG: hypothetical protein ACOCQ2_01585 [Halanaerobiales bacterium]
MDKRITKIVLILIFLLSFTVIRNFNGANTNDITNKYNLDDLSSAVLVNDLKLVEEIINDSNLDINQKDSSEKYPLEVVLVMENCEMAELLLEHQANPYLITSNGQSIYDLVIDSNNKTLKNIFEESY